MGVTVPILAVSRMRAGRATMGVNLRLKLVPVGSTVLWSSNSMPTTVPWVFASLRVG